jgi:hypothetical protein
MRIEWVKVPGRRGIAVILTFGKAVHQVNVLTPPAPERELWRVCEVCKVQEAGFYCRAHFRFVCACCTSIHFYPGECDFVSQAVCRELANVALSYRTEHVL